MAYAKHKFDGIASVSATFAMTAMAGGPLAFLTTGFLGKITFFLLKKMMNGFTNNGLAVLNLGVDFLSTNFQERDFDEAMRAALIARDKIITKKGRLTKEEMDAIDLPVKNTFRKFVRLA